MHEASINLATLRNGKTGRSSSWDTTGRNQDCWSIAGGTSRVLADIAGPGVITHIWITQSRNYRECLLKITWDDAPQPSVLCPLGDFFGLGHGIVFYSRRLAGVPINSGRRRDNRAVPWPG